MAITTLTPVTSSVINPGDAFSFTIDNTFTVLQVEVDTQAGVEFAYDVALGGPQGGYTVVVTPSGGQLILTVSRTSGWDLSPQTIRVIEDEAGGSPVTTAFSYFLAADAIYPENHQPYNAVSQGTLLVTEDDVSISQIVGQLDFDDVTFNVTDLGNGKVRIVGLAVGGSPITIQDEGTPLTTAVTLMNFAGTGVTVTEPLTDEVLITIPGGASDLDATINATTPDNDVNVPSADPILLKTGAADFTVLTIDNTGGAGGVNPMRIISPLVNVGLSVESPSVSTVLNPNSLVFQPSAGSQQFDIGPTAAPTFGIGATVSFTGGSSLLADAGDIQFTGGLASGSGAGGDIIFDGGPGSPVGKIRIGEAGSEIDVALGMSMLEAADHPVTPVATKGQWWVRSDTPNVPVFTDDAGTDWVLNAAGAELNDLETICTGILANEVPVGSGAGVATYTATTGTGSVVRATSPTIVTPTIASFTNATHTHQDAAGGGQLDHGLALTGLTDDDHTQYVLNAGTRNQDAALFLERADHVNAPTATFGEVWLENTAVQALRFTDEAGSDHYLLRALDAEAVNNELLTFDGGGGRAQSTTGSTLGQNSEFVLGGSDAGVSMVEKAADAGDGAGTGKIWVRSDTPSVLIFTDDTGVDTVLGQSGGGQTNTVTGGVGITNSGDNVDATLDHDAHTGDVTGSTALTIADEAVTLAKIQHITTDSFLGRDTAATGDVEVLTAATARSVLNVADGATNTPLTGTAPVDVTKAAAVVGVSSEAARQDHKHDISTATAGAATPGDAATEGAATSLARSDHQHSLPAFGTGAGTFAEGNDTRIVNALQTDASNDADGVQFLERADHPNAPAATFGQLWVRNDAPNKIIFTDDAGTDFDLTSGGAEINDLETVCTGIVANEVPVGSGANVATYTATTGTGNVVRATSPTIVTPTIASFTNATHTHQNAAGGGQLDHGLALTGLTDDDHTQYVLNVGTRNQDAAYFSERADHVNTPGATFGELWLRNDTPNVLVFTDDAGTDTVLGQSGGGQTNTVTGGVGITNSGDNVDATLDHDAHTGEVTGSTALTIAVNVVDNTNLSDMAANTVKANATAGVADPADLAVGTNTVVGRVAGNIVAAQLATGQVADEAITLPKLAHITTDSFLGRDTAATGDVEVLTGTQATSLLDAFTAGLQGVAPASGGGTTNFLRADGTWTAPTAVEVNDLATDGILGIADNQLAVGTGAGTAAYATLSTAGAVSFNGTAFAQAALANLSDVTATTGTGSTVVFDTSPTIVTPTIASFVNASHDHSDAANGGVLANDSVTNAMLSNMAANTVKANATAGLADPADLAVGTNTVVGRVAGNIVAAQLATGQVADDAITYAKIQNVSTTNVFLGRDTAGAGVIEEIAAAAARTILNVADGAEPKPTLSKSITIESPTATEDISVFFSPVAITVTEMRAVVRGTTPSVTWTIRHGTDRSAAGAQVVTGGTATTSQSTGSDVTAFNDATIVADSFVWLETTAATGTNDEIHVTIVYTED